MSDKKQPPSVSAPLNELLDVLEKHDEKAYVYAMTLIGAHLCNRKTQSSFEASGVLPGTSEKFTLSLAFEAQS